MGNQNKKRREYSRLNTQNLQNIFCFYLQMDGVLFNHYFICFAIYH